MTRAQQEIALVGASLAVVAGLVAVMAGFRVDLPDVAVKATVQAFLGGLVGVLLMVAGGYLVFVGIAHGKGALAVVLGAILAIFALPLVGVAVGIPPFFEPILGILQALVDLVNLLIQAADKVIR